jgi:diphosphomevalonate decarboxylase
MADRTLSAVAAAHPNIALVKYWGKRPGTANVPAVPSLSVTLDGLTTRTRVSFDADLESDTIVRNGSSVEDPRVIACLDRLRERAGKPTLRATIDTTNDFPTAAGLASSASGFAALVTAADAALGLGLDAAERSVEARIASASAARSVYGGFVALNGVGTDSSTWRAVPLDADPAWLNVVIAICDPRSKDVSSAEGMRRSALTSPYYDRWVAETRLDFALARDAVEKRDFERLATVAEASCLKMHAVMLTTRPMLVYWNGATLECMRVVTELRAQGTPVFFTIDAGPQVKAICVAEAAATVAKALSVLPGVLETRTVKLGAGARIEDR